MPPEAVPALQAALQDDDLSVRLHAAMCLCSVPGKVKEAELVLMPALANKTARSSRILELQHQAVTALGKAGPAAKDAIPALLEALKTETADTVLAGRIGSALVQIGGPEMVETLVQAFARVPKVSRPMLAHALSQTGPAGVSALVKLINDREPPMRTAVVGIMSRPGRNAAEAVPVLIKAVRDKETKIRLEALRALGAFGPAAKDAIPALTELLKQDQGPNRVIVAETLAKVDPRNPAAISALEETAQGHNLPPRQGMLLRQDAIRALGRLGPDAQAALPVLEKILASGDPSLRLETAIALARVGGDLQAVLPVLLAVIRDRTNSYRARTLEALSQVHTADLAVIATLVQLLSEVQPARVTAAEILGRMGTAAQSAVPALTVLLKASDPETRLQAALALWRIDGRTAETVPVLVAALTSLGTPRPEGTPGPPPPPPCRQAAEALAEMGPAARAAEPALLEALHDRYFAAYRADYALALLKIDPAAAKAAVPALIDVLDHKNHAVYLPEQVAAAVRKQAASALGQFGGDAAEAVPALARALEDMDAGVRQEAAKTLGALGMQARPAVAALQKALTDSDAAVRTEAARALQKIGM